jgi:hypothetical protein
VISSSRLSQRIPLKQSLEEIFTKNITNELNKCKPNVKRRSLQVTNTRFQTRSKFQFTKRKPDVNGSGSIPFFVKSKDIYFPLITLIFTDIVSAFIVRLSLRREPQSNAHDEVCEICGRNQNEPLPGKSKSWNSSLEQDQSLSRRESLWGTWNWGSRLESYISSRTSLVLLIVRIATW